MITFTENKNNGILYGISEGKITVQEMLMAIDYCLNNKELPRNLLILEDARLANPEFSPQDLSRIAEKQKKLFPLYQSVRHAVIHNTPENTALAMVFEQKHISPAYKLKVFSTEEGALIWLKKR